tara:strand:- start:356 stop:541 length:186 start_codon:yes stop_codon:yes gene_type:complete
VVNTVVINDLDISIFSRKVVIYDRFNDVSQEEAEKIVAYLHNEGFIRTIDVALEIEKGKRT